MQGIQFTLYMQENQQHHGMLLYEWFLQQAQQLNIQGATVFRSIAGYGRHQVLHEEHFFELASNTPLAVVFILDEHKAQALQNLILTENLALFYLKIPVEYGITAPPPV